MHPDLPSFDAPRQDDSANPMLALLSRYAAIMRTVEPDDALSTTDRITIAVATRFIYTRVLEQTGRATPAEVSDAATRVQWAMTREPSGRVALRNRIAFDQPLDDTEEVL